MDNENLINVVRECAYEVRKHLRAGFLESVYRKALVIELKAKGLTVSEEVPINVNYKGYNVGDFRADIVVDNKLIIELKAIKELSRVHDMQLVNYLTATGIDDGMLINYGGDDFRCVYKTRLYNPKNYNGRE